MKTKNLILLLMVLGMAFAAGCQAPGERTSGAPLADPHSGHAGAPVVDPHWPVLPEDWLMGEVSGIAVDMNDHIWLVQRPRSLNADEAGLVQDPPLSACCIPAPPVLKFDADGTLLDSWGDQNGYPGEGYEWPASEHGIFVDHLGYVWIAGNGPDDHQVLKFSGDGTFVMQIGQAGRTEGSNNTEFLGRPADMEVDPETNELYIADGYLNKRIIVFNAETGDYLRHWGAYGNEPSDEDTGPFVPGSEPIQQFRTPVHAVRIARDGMVYVADRVNNRIQVFEKDGTYVSEMIVEGNSLGNGSTWDLELSPDAGQVDLYNADGQNQRIHIINRAAMEVETYFGRRGRNAGQFHWVHNVVVDSNGNFYTAEVNQGRRAQKFVVDGAGELH
ncbi:MAG: hypothetical protein F4Y71_03290 [Acidobacteria bacterium]|nr:hypothetical protein [Acidobacteriota bacterium]MXW71933.1 hypothetical protein [Acidobacteriota bacterium]MXX85460.1 hypothetical protein [Acidobacteriota bacterium]MYE42434.1 hypothetical protein [Acidobacteriota bacterium]MYF77484.1 hypothetical protein [Acidobacteriota bacterium]